MSIFLLQINNENVINQSVLAAVAWNYFTRTKGSIVRKSRIPSGELNDDVTATQKHSSHVAHNSHLPLNIVPDSISTLHLT